MASPFENSRPRRSTSRLLKPDLTGSEALLPLQNPSASSSDSKALSSTVFFHGWRFASTKFRSWVTKMSDLHEPTWRRVGIFEAIMASTYKIQKDDDLVLALVEKWCPDTKSFVFPWGEATITLEDVMVLLGFPVLGQPYFAPLNSSGEKTKQKLEKECQKIKKEKRFPANEGVWISRFMDSGDELEHAAFLSLWLSYFVFPPRYYLISEVVLPIAVHLSSGTTIALAPPVLAHLYSELTLLNTHIRAFSGSTIPLKIDLSSLCKLVLVWIYERFPEVRPKPNPLLKGEPRLARWHQLKEKMSNAKQILHSSTFEGRPYTKALENWNIPPFYPRKAMWVRVSPNLDEKFISFARCINASELVGIDCVEHYFSNRVASQFGIVQNLPPSPFKRNSLSKVAAWNDYSKPLGDMIYIPSRSSTPQVIPRICEQESTLRLESAETSKARHNNTGGDTSFVRSGSKMKRRSEDEVEKSTTKMRVCEDDTMGRRQTQVPSENGDKEDDTLNAGQAKEDASEPICKTSSPLTSLGDNGDETVSPPQVDERNEKTNETGGARAENMVLSPVDENNASDAPLGANGGVVEPLGVSPLEASQTCNDINGSNEGMMDGGSTEPECLLHGDDGIVGGKERSYDGSLIQNKLGTEEVMEEDIVGDDSLIQNELGTEEVMEEDIVGDDSLIQNKLAREEEDIVGDDSLIKEHIVGDETSMGLGSYVETNTSDPPHVGLSGGIDTVVIPPETRETCNDVLDVHGSNEDGKLWGEEGEKEDDVVADGRIDESVLMVLSQTDELNIHVNVGISVGDGNQRQVDIGVSPLEASETCNDELDSNAGMMEGGNREPECLLHGDGGIVGEKAGSDDGIAGDDSLIQNKLATEEVMEEDIVGDETSMGLNSYVETNTSDPPVGLNGAIDTVVLPPETRETCNDVHGSNEDMVDDGSKEPKCLLQEDDVVADGRIDESIPMVGIPTDESNIHVNEVGDRNQRKGLGTPKATVSLQLSDSYAECLSDVKAKIAKIQEHIDNAQRNLAWLNERSAENQRIQGIVLDR